MKNVFATALACLSIFLCAHGNSAAAESDVPEDIYLVGAITLAETDSMYTFMGVPFEREGEVFICRDVPFHKSMGEYAEFAIVRKQGQENIGSNISYFKSHTWSMKEQLMESQQLEAKNGLLTMGVTPGEYDFYLNFATGNPTLTIVKADASEEDIDLLYSGNPDYAFYVVGDPVEDESGAWTFDIHPLEYTYGRIFKAENVVFAHTYPDGLAHFVVSHNGGAATWTAGPFLVADRRNWSIPEEQLMLSTTSAKSCEMTIAPGTYTFTLDYTTFVPMLSIRPEGISVGVEAVRADEARPEYFSITGLPLPSSATGLVICRRGATVCLEYR